MVDLNIKDKLKLEFHMAQESCSGQMVIVTKASSDMVNVTAKGNDKIRMEVIM